MSDKDCKIGSRKDNSSYKLAVIFAYLVLACAAFVVGNLMGSMKIDFVTIVKAIFNNDGSTAHMVIKNIRLPRMMTAAMVGVNLAMSGAILQGVMGNPLADPGIIGISSGAGLVGIVILILFPQYQFMVPIGAFIGAMGAAVIIYILAWKGGIQPMRIILAGISALMVFYSDRVHGALTFMNGSLSARSWPEVYTILPYTIAGTAIAFLMSQRLNILVLGDDTARGLGLNVEATRLGMTALAALLAASAVSVVGLLGFVGLIIPHAVRLMIGNDYKFLFPGSAVLGAAVVMFSDTFARTAFSPAEIPVGVVMAVLGAPFFLYLLRRDQAV
jgi:iron complex transport system permease protein